MSFAYSQLAAGSSARSTFPLDHIDNATELAIDRRDENAPNRTFDAQRLTHTDQTALLYSQNTSFSFSSSIIPQISPGITQNSSIETISRDTIAQPPRDGYYYTSFTRTGVGVNADDSSSHPTVAIPTRSSLLQTQQNPDVSLETSSKHHPFDISTGLDAASTKSSSILRTLLHHSQTSKSDSTSSHLEGLIHAQNTTLASILQRVESNLENSLDQTDPLAQTSFIHHDETALSSIPIDDTDPMDAQLDSDDDVSLSEFSIDFLDDQPHPSPMNGDDLPVQHSDDNDPLLLQAFPSVSANNIANQHLTLQQQDQRRLVQLLTKYQSISPSSSSSPQSPIQPHGATNAVPESSPWLSIARSAQNYHSHSPLHSSLTPVSSSSSASSTAAPPSIDPLATLSVSPTPPTFPSTASSLSWLNSLLANQSLLPLLPSNSSYFPLSLQWAYPSSHDPDFQRSSLSRLLTRLLSPLGLTWTSQVAFDAQRMFLQGWNHGLWLPGAGTPSHRDLQPMFFTLPAVSHSPVVAVMPNDPKSTPFINNNYAILVVINGYNNPTFYRLNDVTMTPIPAHTHVHALAVQNYMAPLYASMSVALFRDSCVRCPERLTLYNHGTDLTNSINAPLNAQPNTVSISPLDTDTTIDTSVAELSGHHSSLFRQNSHFDALSISLDSFLEAIVTQQQQQQQQQIQPQQQHQQASTTMSPQETILSCLRDAALSITVEEAQKNQLIADDNSPDSANADDDDETSRLNRVRRLLALQTQFEVIFRTMVQPIQKLNVTGNDNNHTDGDNTASIAKKSAATAVIPDDIRSSHPFREHSDSEYDNGDDDDDLTFDPPETPNKAVQPSKKSKKRLPPPPYGHGVHVNGHSSPQAVPFSITSPETTQYQQQFGLLTDPTSSARYLLTCYPDVRSLSPTAHDFIAMCLKQIEYGINTYLSRLTLTELSRDPSNLHVPSYYNDIPAIQAEFSRDPFEIVKNSRELPPVVNTIPRTNYALLNTPSQLCGLPRLIRPSMYYAYDHPSDPVSFAYKLTQLQQKQTHSLHQPTSAYASIVPSSQLPNITENSIKNDYLSLSASQDQDHVNLDAFLPSAFQQHDNSLSDVISQSNALIVFFSHLLPPDTILSADVLKTAVPTMQSPTTTSSSTTTASNADQINDNNIPQSSSRTHPTSPSQVYTPGFMCKTTSIDPFLGLLATLLAPQDLLSTRSSFLSRCRSNFRLALYQEISQHQNAMTRAQVKKFVSGSSIDPGNKIDLYSYHYYQLLSSLSIPYDLIASLVRQEVALLGIEQETNPDVVISQHVMLHIPEGIQHRYIQSRFVEAFHTGIYHNTIISGQVSPQSLQQLISRQVLLTSSSASPSLSNTTPTQHRLAKCLHTWHHFAHNNSLYLPPSTSHSNGANLRITALNRHPFAQYHASGLTPVVTALLHATGPNNRFLAYRLQLNSPCIQPRIAPLLYEKLFSSVLIGISTPLRQPIQQIAMASQHQDVSQFVYSSKQCKDTSLQQLDIDSNNTTTFEESSSVALPSLAVCALPDTLQSNVFIRSTRQVVFFDINVANSHSLYQNDVIHDSFGNSTNHSLSETQFTSTDEVVSSLQPNLEESNFETIPPVFDSNSLFDRIASSSDSILDQEEDVRGAFFIPNWSPEASFFPRAEINTPVAILDLCASPWKSTEASILLTDGRIFLWDATQQHTTKQHDEMTPGYDWSNVLQREEHRQFQQQQQHYHSSNGTLSSPSRRFHQPVASPWEDCRIIDNWWIGGSPARHTSFLSQLHPTNVYHPYLTHLAPFISTSSPGLFSSVFPQHSVGTSTTPTLHAPFGMLSRMPFPTWAKLQYGHSNSTLIAALPQSLWRIDTRQSPLIQQQNMLLSSNAFGSSCSSPMHLNLTQQDVRIYDIAIDYETNPYHLAIATAAHIYLFDTRNPSDMLARWKLPGVPQYKPLHNEKSFTLRSFDNDIAPRVQNLSFVHPAAVNPQRHITTGGSTGSQAHVAPEFAGPIMKNGDVISSSSSSSNTTTTPHHSLLQPNSNQHITQSSPLEPNPLSLYTFKDADINAQLSDVSPTNNNANPQSNASATLPLVPVPLGFISSHRSLQIESPKEENEPIVATSTSSAIASGYLAHVLPQFIQLYRNISPQLASLLSSSSSSSSASSSSSPLSGIIPCSTMCLPSHILRRHPSTLLSHTTFSVHVPSHSFIYAAANMHQRQWLFEYTTIVAPQTTVGKWLPVSIKSCGTPIPLHPAVAAQMISVQDLVQREKSVMRPSRKQRSQLSTTLKKDGKYKPHAPLRFSRIITALRQRWKVLQQHSRIQRLRQSVANEAQQNASFQTSLNSLQTNVPTAFSKLGGRIGQKLLQQWRDFTISKNIHSIDHVKVASRVERQAFFRANPNILHQSVQLVIQHLNATERSGAFSRARKLLSRMASRQVRQFTQNRHLSVLNTDAMSQYLTKWQENRLQVRQQIQDADALTTSTNLLQNELATVRPQTTASRPPTRRRGNDEAHNDAPRRVFSRHRRTLPLDLYKFSQFDPFGDNLKPVRPLTQSQRSNLLSIIKPLSIDPDHGDKTTLIASELASLQPIKSIQSHDKPSASSTQHFRGDTQIKSQYEMLNKHLGNDLFIYSNIDESTIYSLTDSGANTVPLSDLVESLTADDTQSLVTALQYEAAQKRQSKRSQKNVVPSNNNNNNHDIPDDPLVLASMRLHQQLSSMSPATRYVYNRLNDTQRRIIRARAAMYYSRLTTEEHLIRQGYVHGREKSGNTLPSARLTNFGLIPSSSIEKFSLLPSSLRHQLLVQPSFFCSTSTMFLPVRIPMVYSPVAQRLLLSQDQSNDCDDNMNNESSHNVVALLQTEVIQTPLSVYTQIATISQQVSQMFTNLQLKACAILLSFTKTSPLAPSSHLSQLFAAMDAAIDRLFTTFIQKSSLFHFTNVSSHLVVTKQRFNQLILSDSHFVHPHVSLTSSHIELPLHVIYSYLATIFTNVLPAFTPLEPVPLPSMFQRYKTMLNQSVESQTASLTAIPSLVMSSLHNTTTNPSSKPHQFTISLPTILRLFPRIFGIESGLPLTSLSSDLALFLRQKVISPNSLTSISEQNFVSDNPIIVGFPKGQITSPPIDFSLVAQFFFSAFLPPDMSVSSTYSSPASFTHLTLHNALPRSMSFWPLAQNLLYSVSAAHHFDQLLVQMQLRSIHLDRIHRSLAKSATSSQLQQIFDDISFEFLVRAQLETICRVIDICNENITSILSHFQFIPRTVDEMIDYLFNLVQDYFFIEAACLNDNNLDRDVKSSTKSMQWRESSFFQAFPPELFLLNSPSRNTPSSTSSWLQSTYFDHNFNSFIPFHAFAQNTLSLARMLTSSSLPADISPLQLISPAHPIILSPGIVIFSALRICLLSSAFLHVYPPPSYTTMISLLNTPTFQQAQHEASQRSINFTPLHQLDMNSSSFQIQLRYLWLFKHRVDIYRVAFPDIFILLQDRVSRHALEKLPPHPTPHNLNHAYTSFSRMLSVPMFDLYSFATELPSFQLMELIKENHLPGATFNFSSPLQQQERRNQQARQFSSPFSSSFAAQLSTAPRKPNQPPLHSSPSNHPMSSTGCNCITPQMNIFSYFASMLSLYSQKHTNKPSATSALSQQPFYQNIYHQSINLQHMLTIPSYCHATTCLSLHTNMFIGSLPTQVFALRSEYFGLPFQHSLSGVVCPPDLFPPSIFKYFDREAKPTSTTTSKPTTNIQPFSSVSNPSDDETMLLSMLNADMNSMNSIYDQQQQQQHGVEPIVSVEPYNKITTQTAMNIENGDSRDLLRLFAHVSKDADHENNQNVILESLFDNIDIDDPINATSSSLMRNRQGTGGGVANSFGSSDVSNPFSATADHSARVKQENISDPSSNNNSVPQSFRVRTNQLFSHPAGTTFISSKNNTKAEHAAQKTVSHQESQPSTLMNVFNQYVTSSFDQLPGMMEYIEDNVNVTASTCAENTCVDQPLPKWDQIPLRNDNRPWQTRLSNASSADQMIVSLEQHILFTEQSIFDSIFFQK